MKVLSSIGSGFGAMVKDVVSGSLWAGWGLTSLVVALAGPFGTFATQPFLWRLTYWGALIAIAIIIAIVCRAVWRILLSDRSELHEDLAVCLSQAVIFGPVVIVVNRALCLDVACVPMGYISVMGCVFAITLTSIVLRRAVHGAAAVAPPDQPKQDRLFSRISAGRDTGLSRISSDNHHIRIITDDGEEHRILMRLRDAVEETDVEGVFVHRSHWVAKRAIVGIRRAKGRDTVKLVDGDELPIGPKYRENLNFAPLITD